MPGGAKYFYDSYALISYLEDAEGYRGFELSEGVTTLINLMEVHYFLRRNGRGEPGIREVISNLLPLCIGFSEDDCYEAVRFRYANKRKRLSYINCLGYVLAKREGLEFVTGDREFERMKNVRFVR